MNILIIEDDEVWQHKIRMMLAEFDANIFIVDSITTAQNSLKTLMPNLIVSDVVLPDGEIFALFAGLNNSYPIIFMTNYPKDFYLQQALVLNNAHFLVKPFHSLTFQGLVKKLLYDESQKADPINSILGIYIWGKYNQKVLIPYTKMAFIKSDRNYSAIYTRERSYLRKISLMKLKNELNHHFIQIHRSYIVNIDFVQRVELAKKKLIINGEPLPLGRSYQNNLIKKLTELKGY